MPALRANDAVGIAGHGSRYSKRDMPAEISDRHCGRVRSWVSRADVRCFGDTAVAQGQVHDVPTSGSLVDVACGGIGSRVWAFYVDR